MISPPNWLAEIGWLSCPQLADSMRCSQATTQGRLGMPVGRGKGVECRDEGAVRTGTPLGPSIVYIMAVTY